MQELHGHHDLLSSMCLVYSTYLNQFNRVATAMNRAFALFAVQFEK